MKICLPLFHGFVLTAAADFPDSFLFKWRGSYIDLYEKKLRMETWDWEKTAVNRFIASAEIPLVAIARGFIAQELILQAMFKPDKTKPARLR
jgi:hypothetical protein